MSEAREIVKGLMHEAYKHGAKDWSDMTLDVNRSGEKFLEEVLAAVIEETDAEDELGDAMSIEASRRVAEATAARRDALSALRSWWAARKEEM